MGILHFQINILEIFLLSVLYYKFIITIRDLNVFIIIDCYSIRNTVLVDFVNTISYYNKDDENNYTNLHRKQANVM